MSFKQRAQVCVVFLVACGAPGDKNTSASTSSTTGVTGGSDTGTQGASTSTSAAATSSAATTDSTSATATSTATTSATTGPTSGDSGSTGGACSKQTEPCNAGQQCCDGLTCCSGVPVPRGEEFCSDNCPISDRNAKTDLRPVDASEVLSRVVALDITTWRYKHDGAEVRHLGPMAQDFKAAFGLWNTDRMIFPLDAAGVSLAAIQGLHRRLVAAEAENDDLRARLDRLERRLAALSPAQP
ncbi:tail fiber domain-containing protein [Nannocystis sp. ILAH1]|uniref:tail fiber domain-containing protein n=1 Tax=unclassified Nannocystis TaxID=2627009 RepID=UPI002270CFC8|nr:MULTISPECIES: tail fiber domain-containing protein [unclassified Nannocystis]MCY0989751.1 tail fiber domain-containing protein [Nannocystis sp. ILAH1]MCY1071160.1 tail fiber domain-containing protein [Nannocystis sp. RBIL2]